MSTLGYHKRREAPRQVPPSPSFMTGLTGGIAESYKKQCQRYTEGERLGPRQVGADLRTGVRFPHLLASSFLFWLENTKMEFAHARVIPKAPKTEGNQQKIDKSGS